MAKTENELIIIGIDSSTSCTGICVIEKTGKKEKLLNHSKVIPPPGLSYEEKVIFILDAVLTTIGVYKGRDRVVAIELLNSPKNLNTTRKLAGLWACIKVDVFDTFGLRVASLNTISVKKWTTGDGKADKYKIVKYINKYFNLDLKFHKTNKEKSDDDIADSIAVALSVSRLIDKGERIEDYY